MKHLIVLGALAMTVSACDHKESPLTVTASPVVCFSKTSGEVKVHIKPASNLKGAIRFNVRVTLDDKRVIDLPEQSGTAGRSSSELVLLTEPKRIVVLSESHSVHYDLGRFDPAKLCAKH